MIGWIVILSLLAMVVSIIMFVKAVVKKEKKSKSVKIFLAAVVVFFICGLLALDEDSPSEEQTKQESVSEKKEDKKEEKTEKKEAKKEEKKEEKEMDWTVCHNDDDDYKMMYVSIVHKAVDNYISGVKYPWSFDEYTCVDYDDTKSGTIACTLSSVEIKNVVEKQTIIVIFTIDEKGETYRVNSVAVGGTIYQDDGKLQSLLDKLSGN